MYLVQPKQYDINKCNKHFIEVRKNEKQFLQPCLPDWFNLCMLFCCLLIFFKINFSEKSFRNIISVTVCVGVFFSLVWAKVFT